MTDTMLWVPDQHLRGGKHGGGGGGGPDGRRRSPGADMQTEASGDPVVLIRPDDQVLQDEIARISVAAGVTLSVAEDLPEALRLRPGTLLVSAGYLRAAGGRPLAALRGTETICVGSDNESLWAEAAQCGMDRVALLPAAGGWLAEHLARRNSPTGRVVGVAGTFGGAGSSTLACLLAREGAAAGRTVLLADADPGGGGLEYRLGAGQAPGLRWPDLSDVRGTINPLQLASALPALGGFSLLVNRAGDPAPDGLEPEVLPSVLEAARAAFGLTLLDLGTCPLPGSPALSHCDTVLAVLSGRPQLLLAARAWRRSLQDAAPDTLAVVRGPLAEGLDEVRIADAAGLPLAGYLPHIRSMAAAEDHGRLLELRRRRLRRALAGILELADPPARGSQ